MKHLSRRVCSVNRDTPPLWSPTRNTVSGVYTLQPTPSLTTEIKVLPRGPIASILWREDTRLPVSTKDTNFNCKVEQGAKITRETNLNPRPA